MIKVDHASEPSPPIAGLLKSPASYEQTQPMEPCYLVEKGGQSQHTEYVVAVVSQPFVAESPASEALDLGAVEEPQTEEAM